MPQPRVCLGQTCGDTKRQKQHRLSASRSKRLCYLLPLLAGSSGRKTCYVERFQHTLGWRQVRRLRLLLALHLSVRALLVTQLFWILLMIAIISQMGLEYPLISRAFMLNNAAMKDRGSLGDQMLAVIDVSLSDHSYEDYCHCSKCEQCLSLRCRFNGLLTSVICLKNTRLFLFEVKKHTQLGSISK